MASVGPWTHPDRQSRVGWVLNPLAWSVLSALENARPRPTGSHNDRSEDQVPQPGGVPQTLAMQRARRRSWNTTSPVSLFSFQIAAASRCPVCRLFVPFPSRFSSELRGCSDHSPASTAGKDSHRLRRFSRSGPQTSRGPARCPVFAGISAENLARYRSSRPARRRTSRPPPPASSAYPTHREVAYRTKNVESFEYGGNRVISSCHSTESGSSIPTASQSRVLAIESEFFMSNKKIPQPSPRVLSERLRESGRRGRRSVECLEGDGCRVGGHLISSRTLQNKQFGGTP
jgi:hypothetical protein